MSQTFILRANDDGRSLVLSNAHSFLDRLQASQSWELTIKRHVKKRSDKQRGALFGLAYKAMMEFSGLEGEQDKQELHSFFCREFFGTKETPFGPRPIRTTTKNEQGEYDEIDTQTALAMYAFIQRRAAEVGCFVQDPDPMFGMDRWKE